MIKQLIEDELAWRKQEWKGRVERGEMEKAEANHRYRCLEDAYTVIVKKEKCKYKLLSEIQNELLKWQRQMGKTWGDQVTGGEITKDEFTHRMKAIINAVDYIFELPSANYDQHIKEAYKKKWNNKSTSQV